MCFPYAGGTTRPFVALSELLPSHVETVAVQLPGRGARLRDPIPTSVMELAAEVSQAFLPLLDLPWVVFGHSMGCKVAFETLRSILTIDEAPAPIHFIGAASGVFASHKEVGFREMSEDQLISYVREKGGTPEAILSDRSLLSLVLPAVRADLVLSEEHRVDPSATVAVDATMLYGHADSRVPKESVLDWRRHFSRDFSCEEINGGHFFIDTNTADVAQCISAVVSRKITGNV